MATISPTSGTESGGNPFASKGMNLKTEDFIKMMLTQLQNQDPLEPAKNQELLAQMSQIGQLQTSNDLQTTLKGLALQNQIGAGGQLIGKQVEGLDADAEVVRGVVTSVRVKGSDIELELDNGKKLPLNSVTAIASASTAPIAKN